MPFTSTMQVQSRLKHVNFYFILVVLDVHADTKTEVLNAKCLEKGNYFSIDFTSVTQSSKHFEKMLMETTPFSFLQINLRNSIIAENTGWKSFSVFG